MVLTVKDSIIENSQQQLYPQTEFNGFKAKKSKTNSLITQTIASMIKCKTQTYHS